MRKQFTLRKHYLIAQFLILHLLLSYTGVAQNFTLVDHPDVSIFPNGVVQGSATMTLNRQNPNIIAVAAETFDGSSGNNIKNIGRYISTNGGQTWVGSDKLDGNVSKLNWVPSVNIGTDGTIYYGAVGETLRKYFITKSTNNGSSFSPLHLSLNNSDMGIYKPSVVIDDQPGSPYAGNMYMLYSELGMYSHAHAKFRRSTDGGVGFSTPFELENTWGSSESRYDIQTGPNGEVYLVYLLGSGTSTGVKFWRSVDGGQTFNLSILVLGYNAIDGSQNPKMNNTNTLNAPSIAVDKSGLAHNGRIYVVVPGEIADEKAVIQMIYSDDGGASWSPYSVISDPVSWQSWRPEVSVDQVTGNVFVAYSSIIGSDYATVTKISASSDGGNTFIHKQVSDVSYKIQEFWDNAERGQNGDIIGLAVHDNKAYVTWTDNRDAKWRIRFSRVDFSPKINGPTVLCNSFNYTVDFPCKGSVTWSVTSNDPARVSLSCTNCPSPTVTKLGDGFATLNATVTSTCGASTVTASFPITVGNPYFAYPYVIGPNTSCLQKGGQILYGVNFSPARYGSVIWGYVEGGSTGPVVYVNAGGLDNAGIRIPNNEQFNGIYAAVENECGVGSQSISVFEYSNCSYDDVTWKPQKENETAQLEISSKTLLTPNPAFDKITLRCSNEFVAGADLQFFNAQGICVLKTRLNKSNQIIDVSKLQKGVYMLQLSNSLKKEVIKFIKL